MRLAMTWPPERSALRAWGVGAAAVLVCAASSITLGVAWAPGWTGIAAQADVVPALVELTMQAVRRCPQCGWIESKQEVLPGVAAPDAPRVYQYTLRRADGSSSVFLETLPVSWRVGERLRVIDGADPLE
jgi:hypothetical protein